MWGRSRGNGAGQTSNGSLETDPGLLSQDSFLRFLRLEQRRAERSGRPFALMLLEFGAPEATRDTLGKLAEALSRTIRETDMKGWYKDGSVLGIIFTEVGSVDRRVVAQALQGRIIKGATAVLSTEQVGELKPSLHFYPHDGEQQSGDRCDPILYPELAPEGTHKNASLLFKRFMDVAGSLLAVILLAPLLIAISIAIKLTSEGPIFFRQQRVGQFGRRFTMLKFRSMYRANNQNTHEEYVKEFIAGAGQSGQTVYKLTTDSRVTPIGKLLRRTSFDELPQFFNVLRGEMSLVGPRPPIPYEVECYDTWHKRRYLTAKPGITGLWQVQGRSRVKFDDMVRMDLRYAKFWSVWLDVKILLRTPRAVVTGDGAH